jgi:hypothetical protein
MTGAWMLAYPRTLADGLAGMDQYWILIAFGMLLASYYMMRPKKRKDPLNGAPRSSLSQERGVEREMQHLLVELTEMTRQISAQLDTRAAKLEALLREADQKMAQLSALKSPTVPIMPAGPRLVTDSIEPEPEDHEKYRDIYTMADRGASVREIAQKFGKPAGEVELILALRPNRNREIEETHEA